MLADHSRPEDTGVDAPDLKIISLKIENEIIQNFQFRFILLSPRIFIIYEIPFLLGRLNDLSRLNFASSRRGPSN